MLQFDLVTIFPEIFSSYFNESIIGRAIKTKKIKVKTHNLRKWTTDRHQKVDDAPYGGGLGLIFKIDPLYKAINAVTKNKINSRQRKIVVFSAKGKPFNEETARRFAKLDQLVLICPRYEGVDERIYEFVDEEISIGDYVLTGGELPAMIVVDAVSRLLPGVLGKNESSLDESFSAPGVLEYPHYTRPEVFVARKKKYCVPKVLLSGNHADIKSWRESKRRIL